MTPATFQTIKLGTGKHTSPEDGACVLELASMLAGEQFSDHPATVCPVIGSFLRAYNDSVDDSRRQDLYAYASQVVGTRGSTELQQARAERMLAWASELRQRRWTRALLPRRLRAIGLRRHPPLDAVGTYAVHAIRRYNEHIHAEALALLDELITIGCSQDALDVSSAPRPRMLDAAL